MAKKRKVTALISVFIFLAIYECAYANEDIFVEDCFRYKIKDNKITILDYGYELPEELKRLYEEQKQSDPNAIPVIDKVIIPNKINGLKVVDIEEDAFDPIYLSFEIKEIVCSDYMTNVRMQSFSPSFVKKVVLGKYTKRFILKAYQRDDISKLYSISVPGNAKYLKVVKNGALYSKDGAILYAVPSGKTGSFKISSRTKSVYKWAFHYSHLKKVIIPKGLDAKSISKYAFKGFGYWTKKKPVVKVPKKKVKAYKKYFAKYAETNVSAY